MENTEELVEEGTTSSSVFDELYDVLFNPLHLTLIAVCGYLLYKLFYTKAEPFNPVPATPPLPPMKKKDMTIEELRKYDGKNEEGRVCVAVNGKVFDVTKGKRFYGPGGPYEAFAGRDASRGLATFQVEVSKEGYDDLSDLNSMQMESVKEWEIQFTEKYEYVGRLLKPGEEATDYSDEEDSSMEHQEDGSNVEHQGNENEVKKEN